MHISEGAPSSDNQPNLIDPAPEENIRVEESSKYSSLAVKSFNSQKFQKKKKNVLKIP